MAGADNNTRTSRLKAIGMFVGITLLLLGLTVGGVYFARQRSGQLARTGQGQVAQQNTEEGKKQQAQKEEEKKQQDEASNNTQQGGTQPPAPSSPQNGNDQTAPQTPPQQPAPQSQPQAQVPTTGPTTVEMVPATGPADDVAFVVRVGMLGVIVYSTFTWLASRKVRL